MSFQLMLAIGVMAAGAILTGIGLRFCQSLRARLTVLLLAIFLVPAAGIVLFAAQQSAAALRERLGDSYMRTAVNTLDTIERTLSERYGDVQAFSLLPIARDSANWNRPTAENPLIATMNTFSALYGCYDLMMLVDPQGKVLAVSTKDAKGQPINTAYLYEKNFANETWLKNASTGIFTVGNGANGTWVDDILIDPDIKRIYPDNPGLTVQFSAPVKDKDGKTIAVWHNKTRYALITGVIEARMKALYEQYGKEQVEYNLLSKDGILLADCNLEDVLNRRSLADAGLKCVEDAMAGNSGYAEEMHKRKRVNQLNGFAKSKGVDGYPGLGWILTTRVDSDAALVAVSALRNSMIVIAGVVALVVAGLGVWFARRFTNPIIAAAGTLQHVERENDLTCRVHVEGNDEIANMSRSLNSFLDRLGTVIQEIASGSNQVAQSSDELATVSTQMSSNASETTSLSQLVAGAADEMSSSVATVASACEEATANVNNVADAARRMSEKLLEVARATETMSNNTSTVATAVEEQTAAINEVSQNTARAATISETAKGKALATEALMNKLGEAATKVGRVVEVISDIADQTNLLALNATIEAASAGEAGKGFAVVANEVKELAKQTAQATEEISEQIREMQQYTNNSVSAIKEVAEVVQDLNGISAAIANALEEQAATVNEVAKSTGSAAEGARLVTERINELSAAAGEVSRNSEEMSTGVTEIARNSAEVAKGSSEVAHNIQRVNKTAGDTAGGADTVQQAANALSEMAARLQGLVAQFKLEEDGHGESGAPAASRPAPPARAGAPRPPAAAAPPRPINRLQPVYSNGNGH